MKSPFHGMDPYIEACGLWGGSRSHLIEKLGEKLADLAPEHYLVRTGERSCVVLVESEGNKSQLFCRMSASPPLAAGRRAREKEGRRWRSRLRTPSP